VLIQPLPRRNGTVEGAKRNITTFVVCICTQIG
jgi:hypothetical protein